MFNSDILVLMKALPFKIPQGGENSIHVDHERLQQFYPHYHFHEEIQLTFIIKGHGMAYIGDQIVEFSEGEIFLLGQKLPHVFKATEQLNSGIESISIFFEANFLGESFLQIPESSAIRKLFIDSKRGMRISEAIVPPVQNQIINISRESGFKRLILLLEVLQLISSEQNEFITGPDYHRPRRQTDGEKITNVFNYLTTNYANDISLAEVADVAHMSPTAFCRYFKQHTRKSYSTFLNEIRVNQACKLLQEDAEAISQIAYRTGFNNISNFNRQFKKITGYTPSDYQKMSL